MFQTPILFLIFNRPEPTFKVFELIKKIKPRYLFIAADGPRNGIEGEDNLCNSSRAIINEINWNCELKTLFRKENLGCGKAVSESITWFFEHVEQGIILEDDTLPNISFFAYCEELLEKYKNDNRIGQIAGNNFGIISSNNFKYSYVFTKYISIWGWATWKRAWKYYDFNMNSYTSDKDSIKDLMANEFNEYELKYRLNIFENVIKNNIDTWDHQWFFCNLIQDMLTIIPTTNLISNIGFGENATHTTQDDSNRSNLQTNNIQFPLQHPSYLIRSELYESLLMRDIRKQKSISKIQQIKNIIKKVINRK